MVTSAVEAIEMATVLQANTIMVIVPPETAAIIAASAAQSNTNAPAITDSIIAPAPSLCGSGAAFSASL